MLFYVNKKMFIFQRTGDLLVDPAGCRFPFSSCRSIRARSSFFASKSGCMFSQFSVQLVYSVTTVVLRVGRVVPRHHASAASLKTLRTACQRYETKNKRWSVIKKKINKEEKEAWATTMVSCFVFIFALIALTTADNLGKFIFELKTFLLLAFHLFNRGLNDVNWQASGWWISETLTVGGVWMEKRLVVRRRNFSCLGKMKIRAPVTPLLLFSLYEQPFAVN